MISVLYNICSVILSAFVTTLKSSSIFQMKAVLASNSIWDAQHFQTVRTD